MDQVAAHAPLVGYFTLIAGLCALLAPQLRPTSPTSAPSALFGSLAALSLATTWTYMFKYFAWSKQDAEVSHLENGWRQKVYFMKHGTSFAPRQTSGGGRRHQIKHIWAFMLLGQVVAVSFAQNLFFVALESQKRRGIRIGNNYRAADHSMLICVALALGAVGIVPATLNSKAFLANLLFMHAVLFVPMIKEPHRIRKSGISVGWLLASSAALSFAARIPTLSALTSQLGLASPALFDTQLYKAMYQTLFSHPAQSSISFDVVFATLSFAVWMMYDTASYPLAGCKHWAGTLLLVTIMPAVGVAAIRDRKKKWQQCRAQTETRKAWIALAALCTVPLSSTSEEAIRDVLTCLDASPASASVLISRSRGGNAAENAAQPSYPNPNVQGNPYIYLAVYSSVPVYEMMVRGIGVMRRRSDSYLNATQILKVAGVEKGQRTKILEKDIAMGVHEKVQGGYGRYQGTWIPFERAVELANSFGVSHLLAPLFDYTAPPPPVSLADGQAAPALNRYAPAGSHVAQGEDHSASAILDKAREQGLLTDAVEEPARKRSRASSVREPFKRPRLDSTNGFAAPMPAQPATGDALKLRRSSQRMSAGSDGTTPYDQTKAALKSVFSIEPESPSVVPDLSLSLPAGIDVDTPIDDNMHTALHWAAALARVTIAKALVNYGADIFRGNNVGETPLIRAVLVTNNSDQDSFGRLLQVLGPSLRTVDDSGRSVLHHAALVAGVKGRASSARYYMETVLEYIAQQQHGHFKDIVDAQDAHGDTALNIAARVGNRSLVRLLLDVGADKTKANKLGLRAGDFGVEVDELAVTAGEEAVDDVRGTAASSAPLRQSSELLTSLQDMFSSIKSDFEAEVDRKNESLENIRKQLRTATKQLADQRQVVDKLRESVAQVDKQHQRISNLERAIADEDRFDWTGRTEIDGSPASQLAGPGFQYRGPTSTLINLPADISIEFDADPSGPAEGSPNALVHLLRLQGWYERVVDLLDQRVKRLNGGEAELEAKLQKVVAKCSGVEVDQVETMLDGLVTALESDGNAIDMTRVVSFLSRVKDGSLAQQA
ncbi:transcriptional regulator swi6 [Microbotryomycetes sp. JL201]|nr:transcriptional regulator swi6 [Microbotryomycetes sp. JL201]